MSPASQIVASVVIPARNEAKNLDFLIDEIAAALSGRSFEVIVVDDGSTDDTGDVVAKKRAAGIAARHIRHARSLGQSAAVRTGVLRANGTVVVTIDGDGQNDPVNIPKMLDTLAASDADTAMVTGQRRARTDGGSKKLASRFANGLRRRVLKDGTVDSGCGLRAVRRDVFLTLPFFDAWHRFLPALVIREGYKVVGIDIVDRPRRFGQSNYGILDRGLRGLPDLFGVWWLMRRFRGRADVSEIT
ncbi:MAG TPA: glycosyltransferase family 2 protein [Bauldia sp.]|nr:glycosyltransferase family 2 protein [Bauldia sp.]